MVFTDFQGLDLNTPTFNVQQVRNPASLLHKGRRGVDNTVAKVLFYQEFH